MNLFNWLIVKPLMYLSRQAQGMKKGTETANKILGTAGPAIAALIYANTGKITSILDAASHDAVDTIGQKIYNPVAIENIIRVKAEAAGLSKDVTDYAVAIVLGIGLPKAQDATQTAIYDIFSAAKSAIQQVASDAAKAGKK